MIGKDELINFKEMWTWLSGYPAHDREYYMKNVVKLDDMWANSCPLANSEERDCDGCLMLWDTKQGSLCTDADSPLYRWKTTSRQHPDNRSLFASQVAVLAVKAIRGQEKGTQARHIAGPDFVLCSAA